LLKKNEEEKERYKESYDTKERWSRRNI